MLNIAIRAARKGGNLILQKYDSTKIFQESNDYIVKNLILYSTKIMSDTILQSYPKHFITSQENNNLFKKSEVQWFINPLNGKINFLKHFPHFCTSISVKIKNITTISVIYDPIKNELFTSVKGQGAQLNGYRIRCNNNIDYKKISIALYFSNNNKNLTSLFVNIIKILFLNGLHLRRTGSKILDLAYIASGRLDCFIDINMKNLDLLSGELIVRESGALISDWFGDCSWIKNGSVFIGNSKISRFILSILRNEINVKHFSMTCAK